MSSTTPLCSLTPMIIQFNAMDFTATLRIQSNSIDGQSNLHFKVRTTHPQSLSCSPVKGTIEANSATDLRFNLRESDRLSNIKVMILAETEDKKRSQQLTLKCELLSDQEQKAEEVAPEAVGA